MDRLGIDWLGDEDVVAVWIRWLCIPISDPFTSHLSQPQPSFPKSKVLMLYFFMQSEQTLWPYLIFASQKVHTAAVFSSVVLIVVSNN